MTVKESRSLRPVIAWRLGKHAPKAGDAFSAVFDRHPFHLLAEEGHVSISGLIGPLWAINARFETFDDADEFLAWEGGNTCKVVLRHEVREHAAGSELFSDVRVYCTSRRAHWRFRPFWSIVSPFSGYIGGEVLAAAVRRAENTSSATS